jgi:hypothetical protein
VVLVAAFAASLRATGLGGSILAEQLPTTVEVTTGMREAMLTRESLGAWARTSLPPASESNRAVRAGLGSLQVTYTAKAKTNQGSFGILCVATIENDTDAAKANFGALKHSLQFGIDWAATTPHTRAPAVRQFPCGSESQLQTLKIAGRGVGIFYTAQDDRHLWMLELVGLPVPPERLDELLGPPLAALGRLNAEPS